MCQKIIHYVCECVYITDCMCRALLQKYTGSSAVGTKRKKREEVQSRKKMRKIERESERRR